MRDNATRRMIGDIANDPRTSYWLRDALRAALQRDPIDACDDAETLARLLGKLVDEEFAAVKKGARA